MLKYPTIIRFLYYIIKNNNNKNNQVWIKKIVYELMIQI